jgi:mono/diheme cytochrome c family protein
MNMANSTRPCLRRVLAALLFTAGAWTADGRLHADDSDKLFKESVRPLLARKCFACHSAKAEELKGNLRLETLELILKGGDQGPAIVAGDAANSFLVRALKYEVEDFQMPPSGRLPDEEIGLVEKWIKSLGPSGKKPIDR